jgi:hypothetical protein
MLTNTVQMTRCLLGGKGFFCRGQVISQSLLAVVFVRPSASGHGNAMQLAKVVVGLSVPCGAS